MNNFIELHLQDGSPLMYNVDKIVEFFPARQGAIEQYGYQCHIVTTCNVNGDTENVKESYDEVKAKIKKCTSTMVIV